MANKKMTNFPRINLIAMLLFACIGFVGCSSITPHENFISQMNAAIGKPFNSSRMTWGGEKYHLSTRTLPNGNVERGYQFRGTCKYFFELDSTTNMVYGWRYEGLKKDCEVPN
ncbi:MAG: hypothetical protein ACOVN3_02365 [Limnohabitans sp.]